MSKRVTTISPQRLHVIWNEGKKINLVDVRTAAEYRAGHVAGARLIPLDELNSETLEANELHSGAGHEETLYLTCESGVRAQLAAERLIDAGYHNLALIEGGTQAWKNAGLPMRRCGNAISLERQVQIAVGVLLVLKVLFGFTIHELFFAAIPLIGAGLIVAGITNWCGMARLIARLPWNQGRDCSQQATA
ncbi:MAG: rhodanese-like domain-containing protein [Gammaproteobacteria bacterium]|jgi:rhodanese-related sulfurtransferase|nr:rhodanese-like domain-containing protein [Gammaproteobacteria bacterium]